MGMKYRRTCVKIILFLFACVLVWHLGQHFHYDTLLEVKEAPHPLMENQGVPPSGQRGRNTRIGEELKFRFKEGFAFPQPRVMKSLDVIENASWIKNLQFYLHSLDNTTKQIYLLTSNSAYIDVLLNWLISAVVRSTIPIHDLLIISMDYSTHKILQTKGFHSVLVAPSFLFLPDFNFSRPFEKVMMLRLTIMRIINHFGFDVAMFDTDAVMLKDPQAIFDALGTEDIIGSIGTIPDDLFEEWKVTICIGVVVVRSSERTEQYWNGMKDFREDCIDDQGKLNYGLKALDIQWSNSRSNHMNTTIHGAARNGLQVSILPYKDVCRLEACDPEQRSVYFVWHKGGHRTRREKLHSARDGNTWFLKYQWNKIRNGRIGKEWLRSIAYLGATMS